MFRENLISALIDEPEMFQWHPPFGFQCSDIFLVYPKNFLEVYNL